MNKDQIREQIAFAIAGVDPTKNVGSAQALEKDGFFSRADAVLAILEGVRDTSRKAAIEEVARDYHEGLAAKLDVQVATHQFFFEAKRLQALAEIHRTCAREIRERVWKNPPSETSLLVSNSSPSTQDGN